MGARSCGPVRFMEALAVEKKKYLEDLTGFAERIEAVRKDFVDYDEANKCAVFPRPPRCSRACWKAFRMPVMFCH